MKWLEQNKQKANDNGIVCEYLVRGVNTKGVHAISVVSEGGKETLSKKWKNFHYWIYSIDKRSNNRKLDLPDYEPIKV